MESNEESLSIRVGDKNDYLIGNNIDVRKTFLVAINKQHPSNTSLCSYSFDTNVGRDVIKTTLGEFNPSLAHHFKIEINWEFNNNTYSIYFYMDQMSGLTNTILLKGDNRPIYFINNNNKRLKDLIGERSYQTGE